MPTGSHRFMNASYELAKTSEQSADAQDQTRDEMLEGTEDKLSTEYSESSTGDPLDVEEGRMIAERKGKGGAKRSRKELKALLNEEFSVGKSIDPDWGELEYTCRKCVNEDAPDGCCTFFSSFCCGVLCRAKRLGNMSVLCLTRTSDGRSNLHCVVGPFWPVLMFVTYPLILFFSGIVAIFHLQAAPLYLQVLWWGSTLTLVGALAFTGCRNPGIVRRWKAKPDGCSHWIWSDQGRTYRPPRARYDGDCGVVIEEFDHTCPWTGTGIGRRNMPAFQLFLCSLCTCIILDILLAGGTFNV